MPKLHIPSVLMLLILININCLAINNYLTKKLPPIIAQLENNNDELIVQRKVIEVIKQALDKIIARGGISEEKGKKIKQDLENIFEQNLAKSSLSQRAIYKMKHSFQFVYNKITDPNAGYLERFAYGAAATAGVAITGYTLYQGGKYTYSALQETTPNIPKPPNVVMQIRKLPSTTEIEKRLIQNNINPKIARDISKKLGNATRSPMGVINAVELILEEHAAKGRSDRQWEILWKDITIVESILQDDPKVAEITGRYLADITKKERLAEIMGNIPK